MRLGVLHIVVLAIALTASPISSQPAPVLDDLAKPFNWSGITSTEVGIQLSLRTRWEDGVMKYLATLTDGKGRIAGYFYRHPDNGQIPMSSFQVTFSDEAGFRLYTLYIHDRTFVKVEGTANLESDGESRCTEKVYRAALKAAKATSKSDRSSHGLNFPTELAATPAPAKR